MFKRIFQKFIFKRKLKKFYSTTLSGKSGKYLLMSREALRHTYLAECPPEDRNCTLKEFVEVMATILALDESGCFKIDCDAPLLKRKYEYVPPPSEFLDC